jgi:Transposase DDE domain
VQTAVDTKHHLIVTHEVTNVGHDRTQLADMAQQAQDTIGRPITVLADRGYFKGEEILRCDAAGIVPLVPKPQTSNSKAAELYDKSDFVYEQTDDTYRCPTGSKAIRRMTVVEKEQTLAKYWTSACSMTPATNLLSFPATRSPTNTDPACGPERSSWRIRERLKRPLGQRRRTRRTTSRVARPSTVRTRSVDRVVRRP